MQHAIQFQVNYEKKLLIFFLKFLFVVNIINSYFSIVQIILNTKILKKNLTVLDQELYGFTEIIVPNKGNNMLGDTTDMTENDIIN